jgi:hypothetical protein
MTVEPAYTDYEQTTDETIEIEPVRKLNWKSKSNKQYWERALTSFDDIYAEMKFHAVGDDDHPRRAAIDTIRSDEVVEVATDAGGRGLTFRELRSGGDMTTVVVAETDGIADEVEEIVGAASFEERLDLYPHFGVPEEAVETAREFAELDINSPIYELACRTPSSEYGEDEHEVVVRDPHPILNVIWGYMGWRFIDFFPPHFEHDASREVAIANGQVFRELGYDEEAEALFEMLKAPMLWSGYHGIGHVKNPHCIGAYDLKDERWEEKRVIWRREHESLAEPETTPPE